MAIRRFATSRSRVMMKRMDDSARIARAALLKGPRATGRFRLRLLLVLTLVAIILGSTNSTISANAVVSRASTRWIGTWAAAPQHFIPKSLQSFRNQSLRLIVHISIGGTKVRIKISNAFGDQPLLIGGAHIAHSNLPRFHHFAICKTRVDSGF